MKIKHCNNNIDSECPISYTSQMIGDPWSIMIIRDLFEGKKRFTQLSNSLKGISSKTLTDRLLFLESKNIIIREQFSELPPRVEYRLSEMGIKLNKVIDEMRKFGLDYIENEKLKNN